MSFNSSVPNPTDFLALSQKQLLANFQAINAAFAENHVNLGNIDNPQGQHTLLNLRPQEGQSPDPNTTADQIALYNKLVAGVPQLFFKPSSNQTPIQMTNSNYSVSNPPGPTLDYRVSTFLAGPFTVYIGYLRDVVNPTVVTLLPFSTLLYVGVTTHLNGTINPNIFNLTNATNIIGNQFTIIYHPSITPKPTIYYMAIGI